MKAEGWSCRQDPLRIDSSTCRLQLECWLGVSWPALSAGDHGNRQGSDNPTLIGGHSKIPNRVGKYPNIEVAFYSTSSWLIQYWHDELPFWVIHLLSTSYMPLHLRKVAIVDPKIQFTLVRPDFGGPVSSSPQATMQSVSKLPDDTVLVRTALKKDETRHNQKVARHP
jgi:hypothetical protein